MSVPILTVNCGSSSIKMAVFDEKLNCRVRISADAIGTDHAAITVTHQTNAVTLPPHSDHATALKALFAVVMESAGLTSAPAIIAHRVVHGGETFTDPVIVDDATRAQIAACTPLAPLHNPRNLAGIEAAIEAYPAAIHVAVFDTAFHHTLPQYAWRYGLPRYFHERWQVRRYGFHGLSHCSMLDRLAQQLTRDPAQTSLISIHLGNGASVAAIEQGHSRDTSMGLTPCEGLIMGTRSGDVDPGLFAFMAARGVDTDALQHTLNHESGLLGLSGLSHDMRDLEAAAATGDANAAVAIDVFCYRVARYIGAMMAALTTLDGLVFTGGIGEHSVRVRQQIVSHLPLLGITLNEHANRDHGRNNHGCVSSPQSRFPVYVFGADEESQLALAATTLIKDKAETTA